jgi:YegS/Rv2252/BmrU family lipid kinase
MADTVVIANPAAAAGRVGRERGALRATIADALGPCRYVETARAGHATALAREAVSEGAARVLSLGGDGTHHEVVNGLMQHPDRARVTYGVLPAGTGGDLRRTLGVWTLADALRAIRDRPARPMDVGHAAFVRDDGGAGTRWFVNLASCGVSGLVDRLVNASSKRLGGRAAFFVGTLRALAQYEPARVRVIADGRDLGEHALATLVVGNGRYAGGGMLFCPDARLDDGELDLVVIPHAGLVRSAMRTPSLYRCTLTALPGVITARVSEVTVEALANTAYLDLDGESPGRATATFRVHPGALRLAGAPVGG